MSIVLREVAVQLFSHIPFKGAEPQYYVYVPELRYVYKNHLAMGRIILGDEDANAVSNSIIPIGDNLDKLHGKELKGKIKEIYTNLLKKDKKLPPVIKIDDMYKWIKPTENVEYLQKMEISFKLEINETKLQKIMPIIGKVCAGFLTITGLIMAFSGVFSFSFMAAMFGVAIADQGMIASVIETVINDIERLISGDYRKDVGQFSVLYSLESLFKIVLSAAFAYNVAKELLEKSVEFFGKSTKFRAISLFQTGLIFSASLIATLYDTCKLLGWNGLRDKRAQMKIPFVGFNQQIPADQEFFNLNELGQEQPFIQRFGDNINEGRPNLKPFLNNNNQPYMPPRELRPFF